MSDMFSNISEDFLSKEEYDLLDMATDLLINTGNEVNLENLILAVQYLNNRKNGKIKEENYN